MNTQQLECFVRVAEKLNFTKAAEELYISTPAVTHHIKNLEEELNTTLFIRTSKMVKLTETGAFFYGEAKGILQKMVMAEKKVKKLASQNLAVLRIGCSSQVELEALEQPLKQLKEQIPDVFPQVIIQDYFSLKSLFENEQLDVLIGTKEMIAEVRDCIFKKVKMVGSYAIVSEDSMLAKETGISFEKMCEQPLIALHPRFIPFQYGNKLQEFITLHAQQHFHFLCENDQSAILLAKCNYGVAVLPEIYIPAYRKGIVVLPFSEGQRETEYGVTYHKNLKEKHIKQFIKIFSENEKK